MTRSEPLPKLSVVMVCYEIAAQIQNTLQSILPHMSATFSSATVRSFWWITVQLKCSTSRCRRFCRTWTIFILWGKRSSG